MKKKKDNRKPIHLALQGGGAHGALTWGVLDYLLEDGRVKIEAISGTSAGALNAAAMANDYTNGDIDQARNKMESLWRSMSQRGMYSPYNYSGVYPLANQWANLLSWTFPIFGFNSPYQNNPFNIHFLKDVLTENINFDQLKLDCKSVRLFVSATNVLNNKLKIFTNGQLSIDVLLASSCLPKLHKAVEIEGEFFWDGGYMGNPSLEPLAADHGANDIVIVQVNPLHLASVPTSALEISERMETIAFNSSLSREIRHIAQMERLIEDKQLQPGIVNGKHLHIIQAEDKMTQLSSFTKFDTSWPFLIKLRNLGRKTAQKWLEDNYEAIGKRDTINLDEWQPDYEQPFCEISE